MTEQELDRRARELVALIEEGNADRITQDEFDQAIERIWGDLPMREKIQVHLRVARLQGRATMVFDSSGGIVGT